MAQVVRQIIVTVYKCKKWHSHLTLCSCVVCWSHSVVLGALHSTPTSPPCVQAVAAFPFTCAHLVRINSEPVHLEKKKSMNQTLTLCTIECSVIPKMLAKALVDGHV